MANTADMEALIGKVVAERYEIVSVLGAGGMGVVFKAKQLTMNRFVAVKLLHAHYSANAHAAGRFEREMQATAKIEHPNTIRVYDYGQTGDGQLFLAVELLNGRTLAQVLREDERPMPLERLLKIAVQIAKALVAAHSEGVVHRDLKPENVMLLDQYGERDFVKVLDFGIARFVEADGEDQQRLTAEGAVVGTPAYMSPEQATGAPPDFRTDLYSFGVMLFEMATGSVPFEAPTTVSLMVKHVQELPPRPSELVPGHVPAALEALILECLEKEPKNRPTSTEDVVRRLEACQPHRAPGALAAATRKTPATEEGARQVGGQGSSKLPWVIAALLVLGGLAAVLVLVVFKGPASVEATAVAGESDSTAQEGDTPSVAISGADAEANQVDGVAATPEPSDGGVALADGGAEKGASGADVAVVLAGDAVALAGDAVALGDGGTPQADVTALEGDTGPGVVAEGDAAAGVADAAPPDPRDQLGLVFLDNAEPDAPASCRTREPAGTLEVLVKAGRLLAGGTPTGLRPGDQEAFDLLTANAALITASTEGQVLLARATLRAVQTPNEALAPAMKAVALCDAWALAHHVLGNVYQAKQDFVKAKQSYIRAKDREPDFVAPLFNAVLIELAEKHGKEAAALLDDILRRQPDMPKARLLRGQALLLAGDAVAAVVDLEVATEHTPSDADAWLLLGQARKKTGELDGAKAAYCKAKELGQPAAAKLCP